MIDNFELICKNYTPTEKIKWVSVDDNKSKTLYMAKLYNRNKKKENYFLSLFMLADERKDLFTLMVRGNLNNWFTQKILGRNLTFEEFKNCLYLLKSEIDLNEHRLLNSKVENIDIKINIDLFSN
jgi:hypothetical protein